jgi:hypothetical protein
MESLAKNKGSYAILIVLIAGMLAYRFFAKPSADAPAATLPIGADIIEMANNLSKASLSREIFSSRGYLMLSDFSTAVIQQPIGRANPFNIIGRD